MRSLRWLVSVLAVVLISTACSSAPAPSPQGAPKPAQAQPTAASSAPASQAQAPSGQKIVLRVTSASVGQDVRAQYLARFKELVEQRTNGRVEVQIFPGAQLYSDGDSPVGVSQGGVELAATSMSQLERFDPAFSSLNIPFLFPNSDALLAFEQSPEGAEFGKSLLKNNVRALGWFNPSLGVMFTSSKKPLDTPEGFKGQKFRALQTRAGTLPLQVLGATPVNMNLTDVPMALTTGAIDGYYSSLVTGVSLKPWESGQKYMLVSMFGNLSGYVYITNSYWEKLPADIQKTIQGLIDNELWKYQIDLVKREDQKAVDSSRSNGMTVNVLTDPKQTEAFRVALKPAIDELMKGVPQSMIDLINKGQKYTPTK